MSELDDTTYTITTKDPQEAKMMIDAGNLLGVIRAMDEHLRAVAKHSEDSAEADYARAHRSTLRQLIEEYGVQEYLE